MSISSLCIVRTHNRMSCLYFLAITCKPVIDIRIMIFAGDEMYSYFVKSVIASVVRRIWRHGLWSRTGCVYLQLRPNIWYKLVLANGFIYLTWEPLANVYSTKYSEKHFLVGLKNTSINYNYKLIIFFAIHLLGWIFDGWDLASLNRLLPVQVIN